MDQPLLSIIRNNISFLKRHTVIVGVSGGPDSMALLDCLYKLQGELSLTCIIAHLEHGFRGQDSIDDAKYVEKFCVERNLLYRMKAVNMPEILQTSKRSSQEESRNQRYAWYKQLTHEYNTPYVVLGHHGDDQIETIVMRIIQGTSLTGLVGMETCSKRGDLVLVRPLLDVAKQQLIQYCNENGIIARLDASNESDVYLRNRIRNKLIPYVEQDYNRNFKQAIQNLSSLAKEDADFIDSTVRQQAASLIIELEKNQQYEVNRNKLLDLHIALQRRLLLLILYYLKKEARFEKKHIDIMIQWISEEGSGGLLQLPAGVTIIRQSESIVIQCSGLETMPELPTIELTEGVNGVGNGKKLKIEILTLEAANELKPSRNRVLFDYHQLKNKKLRCRSRQEGDRMIVWGMNGRKKTKDIFIDEKIPSRQRGQIPVVTADDDILWIAGLRRSNIAPITQSTTQVLSIQYIDYSL